MLKVRISAIVLFFFSVQLKAVTAPKNLRFENGCGMVIGCSFATAYWTADPNAYSFVILSTDSNLTFKPKDGVSYLTSKYYGDKMINDKYSLIYNGKDSEVAIFNLQSGTNYYISVFTYEIANGKPVYYLNSYAKKEFKTLGEKLDFNFSYNDSCQFTNKIKFTNNSNTSNPNASYVWRLYNTPVGVSQYTDEIFSKDITGYTFTKPGEKVVELYLLGGQLGCNGNAKSEGYIRKKILIYSRNKSIPYIQGSDTLLCYNKSGSNLQLNETFRADAAVGNSHTRTWIYENSQFASYPNPAIQLKHIGLNRILYIGSSRFNNRTVCTDSTWLSVLVRPEITTNLGTDIEWNETIKSLILDPGEFASYTWQNKSKTRTMRIEKNQLITNINYFWVSVVDSNGCSAADTIIIYKNSVHVPINNKNDEFMIFPSPANDYFQIQVNDNGDFQYEIYSAEGSIIKTGTGNKDLKISTENICSGVYTLRLNGKNIRTVMPLMIQH